MSAFHAKSGVLGGAVVGGAWICVWAFKKWKKGDDELEKSRRENEELMRKMQEDLKRMCEDMEKTTEMIKKWPDLHPEGGSEERKEADGEPAV